MGDFMTKARVYSQYCIEASALLGRQIRLGRKQKKWTERDLAERANISRVTLNKIEKGDLSCKIGLVFELASLVGIELFESSHAALTMQLDRTNDKIALLPKAIHSAGRKVIDDDF
ncbi:MAG: helix-turn-helix transcriptional regulator [Mariprofundaceae bacterium]|nr:helix-turn-helix transcriptional regulator [Mariprofundaceae bacterium]